jgi:hypothetical protein
MEPLCLGKPGDPGRSGKDNQLFVEAVLCIARTPPSRRRSWWQGQGVSRYGNVHLILKRCPKSVSPMYMLAWANACKWTGNAPEQPRRVEIFDR